MKWCTSKGRHKKLAFHSNKENQGGFETRNVVKKKNCTNSSVDKWVACKTRDYGLETIIGHVFSQNHLDRENCNNSCSNNHLLKSCFFDGLGYGWYNEIN